MNTLDSNDLNTFIRETAPKTGLLEPIIEKDYWVVWILELLFSGPYADQLTFKGGTSLSKAYKESSTDSARTLTCSLTAA